ncbi:hypothetical protein [Clavibacter michiganensis]|uniref:hypothetical protein n=1 Tax=Clavibacter michiganensis TaxID=28447 RepID=UPI003EBDB5C4
MAHTTDIAPHFEGFLSAKVRSVQNLIDVAIQFVTVGQWVGSGTRYEPELNVVDLRFAVSDEVIIRHRESVKSLLGDEAKETDHMFQSYPTADQIRRVAMQGLGRIRGTDETSEVIW